MDGWIFIFAGILLFTLTAMLERRLLLYGNIVTIVPVAALLETLLQWEGKRIPQLGPIIGALIRPMTIIVFAAGFLIAGMGYQHLFGKENPAPEKDMAPLSLMCDRLNEIARKEAAPHPRLLAFIDYGPAILYHTQYDVVATPYHRNSAGILYTYRVMTASSDDTAYELIRQRGIDMILTSNKKSENFFYTIPQQADTFYHRLETNMVPGWLSEVILPPSLSRTYKLFRRNRSITPVGIIKKGK